MGSSSPLATLLRRIGGGLPQIAPTFDYGGSGALDNDGVEDGNHWWGVEGWRAGGPLLIDDKNDRTGGATGVKGNGTGRATATTSASTSSVTD
jgi:hypothetical protein